MNVLGEIQPKRITRKITGDFANAISKPLNSAQKYANFAQDQGINREFCGFLSKRLLAKHLLLFCGGCKKITGNYQGTAE